MKAEDCDALVGIANQLRQIVFPKVDADAMPVADRVSMILVRASNDIVAEVFPKSDALASDPSGSPFAKTGDPPCEKCGRFAKLTNPDNGAIWCAWCGHPVIECNQPAEPPAPAQANDPPAVIFEDEGQEDEPEGTEPKESDRFGVALTDSVLQEDGTHRVEVLIDANPSKDEIRKSIEYAVQKIKEGTIYPVPPPSTELGIGATGAAGITLMEACRLVESVTERVKSV